MELIKMAHCSNCSCEIQNCFTFSDYRKNEIAICETCLITALIMVRPIQLSKEQTDECLQDFIDLNRFNYVKKDEDRMNKFVDWLKPFLEAKE